MLVQIKAQHPDELSYVAVVSEQAGELAAEYRCGAGEIAEAIRKASGDICFWIFFTGAMRVFFQAAGVI